MYPSFKAPLNYQSNIKEIWLEESFRIEFYRFLDGFQVYFWMTERRKHGLSDFRRRNHNVKNVKCTFQHNEKHYLQEVFFEGLSHIIFY